MLKITFPEKPKIIKKEGNYAVFEIRSCYPGYGMTLGNALRRVLLSSLVGCAITSVKIEKANHEFSTIPGVMEDVIEIILNLKKVRFKMYSDNPMRLTLKAKKEGEVKASEIAVNNEIEVVNGDLVIATITDRNATLEMEIKVEKGIGYMTVEQQSEEKRNIGDMAMDAIFTPVKKVNYKVENMRVGKMTNYDKIILEIETDGSKTPEEALKEASELLVEHFSLLREAEKEEKSKKKDNKEEEKEKRKITEEKIEAAEKRNEEEKKKNVLKTSIDELNLPLRVLKVLKENKIGTIDKLVKKSEADIREFSGMGDGGIKGIKKSLGKLGLILKNK